MACELALLASSPAVVHVRSGNGIGDISDRGRCRSVIGVDSSAVSATAAQRRADELGLNCHYVVAELPGVLPCSTGARISSTPTRER